MLAIMNQLRQKNTRNQIISGFYPPFKGVTTTINDGLMTREGTEDQIYFEGDFTAAQGPTFSDMPFDIRCFTATDAYRAHFKRTKMYGSNWSSYPGGAATYIMRDDLTMFILPKVATPQLQDSNRVWNYTNLSGQYMPPYFKWTRTLMYKSGDNYGPIAYWSEWFLEGNGDTPMSPRLVVISGAWRYLIDPRLSKNWIIPNYNPSYPIHVVTSVSGVSFGLVIIQVTTPAAAGTPSFVFANGNAAAWTKAFSVATNRNSRILVDSTGINMPIFLTGVNSA